MKSLNLYWLIDMTYPPENRGEDRWIEKLEDLISYRKNHRDEDWEFAENFPEDEN